MKWERPKGSRSIYDSDRKQIAIADTVEHADLIAQAPKLYEALKGWVDWFSNAMEGSPPITKSQRAIAKAETRA